jgi:hypothetical protein
MHLNLSRLSQYSKGIFVVRLQFPLNISWRATSTTSKSGSEGRSSGAAERDK